MLKLLFWMLSFLILLNGCKEGKNDSTNELLDFKVSSNKLSLFGENLVSTSLYERDVAIAPLEDEIIYTRGDYKQNRRCLVSLTMNDDLWSDPQILNISGIYHDIEPFFAATGTRLFFASDRPIYGDTMRNDFNIWYTDKIKGIWSDPVALDSNINSKNDEFFPSLSDNGNLYFTSTRAHAMGREDIFVARFIDNKFQHPTPLPEVINSELYEFNAFVSPDERYIIFSSFGRPDDFGGGDLYVSEKDPKGNWTMARNLGKEINSDQLDYCPFVDRKSNNFYFTSERIPSNKAEITDIVQLKEMASRIENGFGNIYRIDFTSLNIK